MKNIKNRRLMQYFAGLITSLIAVQAYPQVEEVIVIGREQESLTEPTLQTQKLFAVAGAEGDPLQAIFSLPGVLFASDDGAEPAVRGSAPEDNIFLVDGLPVDNIYHPFGFSVFNKHVVGDFNLLPAAYPAKYNAATGAVFDVRLREPRQQPVRYTLDYSFLRAGVMSEGTISKNQAFYFSYRRSLLDIYFDAADLNDEGEDDGTTINKIPDMSDYQGKYSWAINDKSKLSLIVLGSNDDFDATIEQDAAEALIDPDVAGRLKFDSRFDGQAINWLSYLAKDRVLNFTVGKLLEKEEISLGTGQFLNIDENTSLFKLQYNQPVSHRHTLEVGGQYEQSKFDYAFDLKIQPCDDFDPACFPDQSDRVQDNFAYKSKSYQVYIEDKWQAHDDVKLTLGVSASNDDYFEERLTEPRLRVDWQYAIDWTLSFAAGEYHRPPDGEQAVRIIGNPNLRNLKARHYVAGIKHNGSGGWDWRVELYYKDLFDLPLALSPDQPDAALNYVNEAEGEAYGVEALIEKKLTHKWYGWLAVSLSRSERTDLRSNKSSKFTGDTPAVVNAVMNYQLNEKWNMGLRYTWRTGAAYTPIIGLTPNPDFPTLFRPVYAELNSDRLPNYQRLDVRGEYQFSLWGNNALFIVEVINLLNHENVAGFSYDPQPDDQVDNFDLDKNKGLTFFPSLGLQITF